MRTSLLSLLRCPKTNARLRIEPTATGDDDVLEGLLVAEGFGNTYPIRNGIPRFVTDDTYVSNFGMQWNQFRRTQLDSYSGKPISRDRFYRFSGWSPEALFGKTVLDVGCGAGRFTEVALAAGARVVALDYSSAVDACRENLAPSPNLEVVQADVYALPFALHSFDYVYCFGVLQHTPDVHAAFAALPRQLRPGGWLAVDLYPRLARNAVWSKYWLRPFTSRLPHEKLFPIVQRTVPAMLAVTALIGRIPLVGRQLRYLVPVADYRGVLPLTSEQIREWAVLDTFDMLAPVHDHPQTLGTVERWLTDAGLVERHVERVGFIIGRGRAPVS